MRFENPFLPFGRDAGAVVPHVEQKASLLEACLYVYLRLRRGGLFHGLHGVTEQVGQNLAQPLRIGADGRVIGQVERERGGCGEQGGRALHGFAHVQRL